MTTESNLKLLLDAQAESYKDTRNSILGPTSSATDVSAALNTAAGKLVGAINEIFTIANLKLDQAAVDGRIQNAIDDASSSAATLWSSAKIAQEVAVAAGAGASNTDELPEGTTNLYHTAARVNTLIQGAIDDAGSANDDLWSATQIQLAIDTAVNGLINSAPGLLDTLGEIAAFAQNNELDISNLTNLVNAKANAADVYTKAELGPNFVTEDWAAYWTNAIST